jgi:spore maturation protein CgeB
MAMSPGRRVVYVGDLWSGSTARHRMHALRDAGASVIPIDTQTEALRARERSIPLRILRCVADSPDLVRANSQILAAAEQQAPDVLWIDKGLTIAPGTLHAVRERHPRCVIVGYSPDDMMNPGSQSRRFLAGLPQYDIYFTTKSYGVAELHKLGARRAHFTGNAYDPSTHRPMVPSAQQRAELGGIVGFIGTWEAQRSASICQLAAAGVPVRVWGNGWHKCHFRSDFLRLENRPLLGDDYALALCSFDLNLCFLRKSNRDLQTTRSMEIPACGGFMLAERTDEHLALFEEGKEAEYFASDTELIGKAKYYIAHLAERRAIAEAGRLRCLHSGYSNQDRMLQMLNIVECLKHQAQSAH